MHKNPKINIEILYEYYLILSLDSHTFNCMYGHHFQKKSIKFISNNLPRFDKHINQVITTNKNPTKYYKEKISTSVSLKDILSGNQHGFPLINMSKCDSSIIRKGED